MTMIEERVVNYERFICDAPAKDGGLCRRPLVDVDWERKVIRKKCEQCGEWHTLTSLRK